LEDFIGTGILTLLGAAPCPLQNCFGTTGADDKLWSIDSQRSDHPRKRGIVVSKPSEPAIQTSEVESSDADQLGEVYSGPNVRYLRTKTGPFYSQMKKAVLGELTFHTNHHESHMLMEGVNASDLVAIGFQSPKSKPRLMMGEAFTNADVFLAGPRAEHLATVLPGQHTLQMFVPAKLLENEIASRLHQDPFEFTKKRYLLRLGKHHVRELIDIVALAFRAAHDLIGSDLSQEAVTQMQKTLLEQVVSVLTAEENDLFHEHPSFTSRGWIMLRAREYFEKHEGSPVRLADVCQAVGVGQRALQLAFAEGLGISPMRYLKLRRLNIVHRQLKEASPDTVLVKQAALRAGFTHLGQFAREYRELFGEFPSETAGHER
jgi:AraC-like DNA-binding protein